MIATAQVTVTNPLGLHARPASELSRLAAGLSSSTSLQVGTSTIDAASVLSIMAAGIPTGQVLTVRCEGDHAEDDLAVVVKAIAAGLGE